MNDKIDKAIQFATTAHDGQKRKYTSEPYVNHPYAVFSIVHNLKGYTEDVEIAALLHDTVEDTSVTIDDINNEFGDYVAYLVNGLTDVSKPEDGNRATRKALDRDHLAKGCMSIHTIKLADLIDNTSSIVEHDEEFAKVYMKEKWELLKVLYLGDRYLYGQAYQLINQYYLNIKSIT